jgi:hypothetical protein
MQLDSEFRLRVQQLDILLASVALGNMSARVFQQRFSKAFVETLNKCSNPTKFVETLRELTVYYNLLTGIIPDWKTSWADADGRSKERDDVRRSIANVDHVFGVKPNPKTLQFIQTMLK